MATYKVLQDIEADDKLLWNLSFRQFIYALIAVVMGYVTYLFVANNVWYFSVITIPFVLFFAFLAYPFGRDQPTEVWALAKLRFLFVPRKRIWAQDGTKDLVTITVPKKVEIDRTNGLSQNEVKSRLQALANTIDSRGWAVKNVSSDFAGNSSSDRLVDVSALPTVQKIDDVHDFEDILDESNPNYKKVSALVKKNANNQRQKLLDKLQNIEPETLVKPEEPILEVGPIKPIDQSGAELTNMRTLRIRDSRPQVKEMPPIESAYSPAIMNLASNNDSSVSAVAREANKILNPRSNDASEGEVLVSLR